MDLQSLEEWTDMLRGRITSAQLVKRDFETRLHSLNESIRFLLEQRRLLKKEHKEADTIIEEYTIRLKTQTELIARIKSNVSPRTYYRRGIPYKKTRYEQLTQVLRQLKELADELGTNGAAIGVEDILKAFKTE